MEHLRLNAASWRNADDVWENLLLALGAPGWHGRNLDALADSLRGGDLNAINPPLTVEVQGVAAASAEAKWELARIASVFREMASEGAVVAWAQS